MKVLAEEGTEISLARGLAPGDADQGLYQLGGEEDCSSRTIAYAIDGAAGGEKSTLWEDSDRARRLFPITAE